MRAATSDADGKIRIRFENLSQRLNRINVDIYHKDTGSSYHLQENVTSPDTGSLGCFTLDEFELLKTSDNSPAFNKLYYNVTPLIKSLPELIHHQKQVVDQFVHFVNSAPTKDLASGFSLLSVLGRDLDKELFPHFHSLFGALVKAVPRVAMSGGATPQLIAPNPELTGSLFETCSYLLRANVSKLIEAPQELSPYYGALLGNTVHFVRDFAAKSFTIVTRKLSNKIFKDHFRKLIKAVGNNISQAVDKEKMLFLFDVTTNVENLTVDTVGGDIRDAHTLLEGMSLLLFYTCKGITGQMHSRASGRFESLAKIYQSILQISDEKREEATAQLVSFAGIAYQLVQSLQEYVYAANLKDLSLCVLSIAQESKVTSINKDASQTFPSILLTVRLRFLSLLLFNRKGKGLKSLEANNVELFIKICSESFNTYEEFTSTGPIQHMYHALFVKLCLTFPHNKVVINSMRKIAEKVCGHEEGLLYLANELLPKMNKSLAQEFLLPTLLPSLLAFQSKLDPFQWLALTLPVFYQIKDTREDIQLLQQQVLKSEGGSKESNEEVSASILTEAMKFIEPVKKIFLLTLQSLTSTTTQRVSLTLSSKILSWFYEAMDKDDLNDLKKVENKLTECLSSVIKKKDYNVLVHNPELLVLYARISTYGTDTSSKENVTLLSSLINMLVQYWTETKVESSITIGLTFAFNELIASLLSCLVDAPDYFLTSFLPADLQAKLMDKLSFHLTTPSYWLKWNILTILNYFQPPADKTQKVESKIEDDAPLFADVVLLCRECLSFPVDLHNEREISRRLEIIEVFCRGDDRLPLAYLGVIAGFSVGFLNVKFKPLWSNILNVLITISQTKRGEELIWRLLTQYFGNHTFSSALKTADHLGGEIITTRSAKLIDILHGLKEKDSGNAEISLNISQSSFFLFKVTSAYVSSLAVMPDARADEESFYASIFQLLQKAPNLTLQKSKLIVTAFLGLLKNHYYQIFPDEPEIAILNKFGAFIMENSDGTHEDSIIAVASVKQVKSRVESFLKAFSAVNSPRQMHKHQILYIIYNEFLSKSDSTLANLALDCIMTYKQPEIVTYKDILKKLFDDKAFRNELIRLSTKPEDSMLDEGELIVKDEHKPVLFSTVIRILFGRLTSRTGGKKSDREQTTARRGAVLAFVSTIDSALVSVFIHLMIRGVTPTPAIVDEDNSEVVHFNTNQSDFKQISQEITKLVQGSIQDFQYIDHTTLSRVYWDKMVGFLYLLKPTISILSLGLVGYHEVIHHALSEMLLYSHQFKASSLQIQSALVDDDADDIADVEDDEQQEKQIETKDKSVDLKNASNVRTLCLQNMTDFISHFHTVFDFGQISSPILSVLLPLIEPLPSALLSASKPPALLHLLDQISRYTNSISLLLKDPKVISSIIVCISKNDVEVNSSKIVIEILDRLLDVNEGQGLRPHTEELVIMFTRRFIGIEGGDQRELKLSEMEMTNINNIRYELQFLCKLGSYLFVDSSIKIKPIISHNFATLVLGMVRSFTTRSKRMRMSEEWMVGVLDIYQSMIPRLSDVTSHVTFISRLFGPCINNQSKVFDSHLVRKKLTEVYMAQSQHQSVTGVLKELGSVVADMTKLDANVIESRDYGSLMPVFQNLSDENSKWSSWIGPKSLMADNSRTVSNHIFLTSAMLFEAIRCMFETEMFVRRSALMALKQLVQEVIIWASDDSDWYCIISNILMPAVRNAIKESIDVVKCGFLHLLAHMVRVYQHIASIRENDYYHTDLFVLVHQDPEQDFFENISHIQVHRRARALEKLAGQLKNSEGQLLRVSSLMHVLVPLLFHYLQSAEFQKKLHQKLLEEVTAFFGAAAQHLPWNHYYAVIKRLLKMLTKANEDKEKFIQNAVCSVLDNFHFDMNIKNVASPVVVKVGEDSLRKGSSKRVVLDDEEEEEEEGGENDDDNMEKVDEIEEIDKPPEQLPIIKDTSKPSSAIKNNIAVTVINHIIPWLKAELVKVVKDQHGNKTDKIQTNMALAVTNLIRHLEPPIVTVEFRMGLFSNVVISIVNTLKSRDVKVRDVARNSLSKMIGVIGLGALAPVLYEMQSSLKEGYQRHVNTYSVRSLLSTTLDNYIPPTDAPILTLEQLEQWKENSAGFEPFIPPFDTSIPYIMKTVVEDIGEEMREEREVDGVIRSTMREQKGSKYTDILELVGRCMLFRPTYALASPMQPTKVSSVHAVVGPLLSGLQGAESSTVYSRIAEALQRLAAGIAKNPTVSERELLIYLHSTLQPFVSSMVTEHRRYKQKLGNLSKNNKLLDGEESDMETGLPSYLLQNDDDEEGELTFIRDASLETGVEKKSKKKRKGDFTTQAAAQWLPTDWNALKGQKAVIAERNKQQKEQFQVLDGANAPKLTGRNRYDKLMLSKGNHNASTHGVSRTTLVAIKFCLSVLYSALKKGVLKANDQHVQSMVIPFLPLLRSFLYIAGASDVLILAMKSLSALFTWGVKVDFQYMSQLAGRVLKIVLRQGGSLSMDNELCQAGITCLVSLFKRYNEENSLRNKGGEGKSFPLSQEELRSLVELLTLSITAVTSSYQSTSFQLIKEITQARILLPEIYDLMDKLTEQIVLSHRKGIRDSASAIIVQFMLSYPMSKQRTETHLKQLINNCSYEYEEGRQAALQTLQSVVRVFPREVLHDYVQMIFLSLSLRLVNETAIACREGVIVVLSTLANRSDEDLQQTMLQYALQWLRSVKRAMGSVAVQSGALLLLKVGAQCLTIIAKVSPRLFSSNNNSNSSVTRQVVSTAYEILLYLLSSEDQAAVRAEVTKICWNSIFHVLLLLEQLYHSQREATDFAFAQLAPADHLPETFQFYQQKDTALYERYVSAHLVDLIADLILYPHPWIRSCASRILLFYLQRRTNKKRVSLYDKRVSCYELLRQPNKLFMLSRKVCRVLTCHELPSELEGVLGGIVREVVGVCLAHPQLDFFLPVKKRDGREEDEEEEEREGEGEGEEESEKEAEEEGEGEGEAGERQRGEGEGEGGENISLLLDRLREGEQNLLGERGEGEGGEGEEETEEGEGEEGEKGEGERERRGEEPAPPGSKRVLRWLLHRLKCIGGDRRGGQRLRILSLFHSLLLHATEREKTLLLSSFSPLLLELPARLLHTSPPPAPEVVAAAQALLSLLEGGMGGRGFMTCFAQVQEKIARERRERKEREKREAVVNPQAHAMKKVKDQERKREAKKRKVDHLLALKGGGKKRRSST